MKTIADIIRIFVLVDATYLRGKHTLGFLEDKMVIRTAKQDIQVQYSAVSDVVVSERGVVFWLLLDIYLSLSIQ
jgi:hypothetical protein